jgi:hypothetical protein
MNARLRKFTPSSILGRALEYGMRLILQDGELVVESPPELDQGIRDKALAVITDSREEMIAYIFRLNERYQREMEEEMRLHPEICCVCLGKETSALPDDHDGFMYCVEHHPAINPVVQPVCRTVRHLNEVGLPAKAREKVAKREECGGTAWLQTPTGPICVKCYTGTSEYPGGIPQQ